MSAFCEMLLIARRKKGMDLRGTRYARKRYAAHDVYKAKPYKGRFAIPRTFVGLRTALGRGARVDKMRSLTRHSAFMLEFLEVFRAVNCRLPAQ